MNWSISNLNKIIYKAKFAVFIIKNLIQSNSYLFIKRLNLCYRIVSHIDQYPDRTFQKLRWYQRCSGGVSYNIYWLPLVDKCRFCAYLHEKDCRQRDFCNWRLVIFVDGETILSNNDGICTNRSSGRCVSLDDWTYSRYRIL